MPDKTKYAPQEPHYPDFKTIGTSFKVGSNKRKRGRKPNKKKQYFTADTDAAIKEYLSSSNQEEIEKIQEALNEFTLK